MKALELRGPLWYRKLVWLGFLAATLYPGPREASIAWNGGARELLGFLATVATGITVLVLGFKSAWTRQTA
jgi:hypothetical protein